MDANLKADNIYPYLCKENYWTKDSSSAADRNESANIESGTSKREDGDHQL